MLLSEQDLSFAARAPRGPRAAREQERGARGRRTFLKPTTFNRNLNT